VNVALTKGHRRLAAVLFADLSGFTELVENVEPEVVYQVVRPLMDDLVTIALRHGGEIQQMRPGGPAPGDAEGDGRKRADPPGSGCADHVIDVLLIDGRGGRMRP
jgi:class 3 adenylate cyclase